MLAHSLSRALRSTLALLVLALLLPAAGLAEDSPSDGESGEDPPPVAEVVAGLEAEDGLFRLYRQPNRGRVLLELPAPGDDGLVASVLYVEGLVTGLGSNPVGLDRGQLGRERLFDIRRLGPKVLFEQRNLGFRAESRDPLERRATRQSFATSIEWAAPVVALDEDGTALIDLAPFLLRDVHNVSATLRETGQGSYRLDPERSAVDFGAVLSFPDNLEFEAVLTYALDDEEPGALVARTAPAGEAFSLVQHHSLIRLPDDGYRPRRGDPRIGFFGPQYFDYAAPLSDSIERWLITRHRLEKKDPSAERSEAVEPIVYYVDPGVPEPIRGALIEGASWWAEAFEAAGFIDAYRVEVLPADAHPLDVRYNVIQWVHRSTRGWSYGGGVVDPRTGEMIKGHVSLGSLRVRQDRLLFEGLLGTAKTGTGASDDPIELALARIRQLSAHEVGHTLGITHNFAASTYGRESVMDYPAPLVEPAADEGLDVSRAYDVGVGAWDIHSVRYGYSHFPPGTDEEAALEAIVREGLEAGLLFLTDADARPPGAAEPRANLWDNGEDPVAALESVVEVRRRALERFGAENLPLGEPMAKLEEVLAPVYFHHRYQLEAAVKVLGGVEYRYAVRGDGQDGPRPVDGVRQRRALEVILSLLDPAFLDLPESVLSLLAPRPFGYERNREMFRSETGLLFDALGAAESAADHVLTHLLQPERLARMVDFERRLPVMPGAEDVLDALVEKVVPLAGTKPRHRAVVEAVQRVCAERLMHLVVDPATPERVRLPAEQALARFEDRLEEQAGHGAALADRLERFLDRHEVDGLPFEALAAPDLPPGSPIGEGTRKLPLGDPGCAWAPAPGTSGAW